MRSAKTRGGWEAKVLLNFGHETENAMSFSNKISDSLAANDLISSNKSFVVLNNYPMDSYEVINDLIDFFADSLESVKSEAILLLKYRLEEDQPYQSSLYRATETKFSELCSHSYSKEFNNQSAVSSNSLRGNTNNSGTGSSVSSAGNKNNKEK